MDNWTRPPNHEPPRINIVISDVTTLNIKCVFSYFGGGNIYMDQKKKLVKEECQISKNSTRCNLTCKLSCLTKLLAPL